MTGALRCAARRLLLGARSIQRTPARLSPSFIHGGPLPSPRWFSSHQRGEADRPLTFEEKVALWKRGGHLVYRTANAIATIVASYYILKLSVVVVVNEFREPGYLGREAASFIKRSEEKLRSIRDR